ncbi:unnamed protein product [[Candida] boidinii]|nr:unnamed protein product [[Candida] boidinii]
MQHNPQMTQLQMQYHQQGQVPIQAQSQLQLLDGIQHQNQQLAQTQLAIQQQIQRLQIQKDNLSSNNTELENQLQRQLQFQIMELTKLQSQLHITTLPNNITTVSTIPKTFGSTVTSTSNAHDSTGTIAGRATRTPK